MADELTNAADWEERERRLLDLGEPALLTGLYAYSVLSWIWGLVFGLVATAQCKLEANRRVGKICIILAVVNFVLIGCLVAAYVIIAVVGASYIYFTASPAGGG